MNEANETRSFVLSHLPGENHTLDSTDVHVWCARLDAGAEREQRLELWLSDDEKTRAARFHFERDRARYVVRRAVLRALIGRYSGIHPADVVFRYTVGGKPELAPHHGNLGLHFNSSHSHGLALFALARRPVGVDVERVQPLDDANALARQFFSDAENTALTAVDDSQKAEAFFTCWTRKEAFVKATGEGLRRRLDSFDVTFVPGETAQLLRCADDDPGTWSLRSLRPEADFVGAVATRGEIAVLHLFRMTSHDSLS